jgi:hypothetical protein
MDSQAERACVESDEISRSNETKRRDREFPREFRRRAFAWEEVVVCVFHRDPWLGGRFTQAVARDVAAGGPMDTRRAPQTKTARTRGPLNATL